MSQVYFRKVEEDDEKLIYIFGTDHSNMVRRLTMTKDSGRILPEDGIGDRECQKAGWGIYTAYQRDGGWPEHGYHVSG